MASADKESPDTATKNDADDAIIISTDSGSFASWTLVTENYNNDVRNDINIVKDEADNNGVEDVDEEDDNNELGKANNGFDELKSALEDNSLDELSDGISIISESESSGRLSPHPALRQYLGEFTSKLLENRDYDSVRLAASLKEPLAIATPPQTNSDCESNLRQRKPTSSTSSTSQVQALQPATPEKSGAVYPSTPLYTIRKSLKGIFYFGIALGLVGFVGRLFLPGWAPASSTEPLEQLVQKLNDMELQNNLMRAEIDLLTKQMTYLNSINEQPRKNNHDGHTSKHGQVHYKDHETKGLKSNSVEDGATKGEFPNDELKRETLATSEFETINRNSRQGQRSDNSPKKEELQASEDINKNGHQTFQINDNLYNRKRMEEKFNKDYSNNQGNKAYKEEFINSKEFLKKHHNRGKVNNGDRASSRERHRNEDDGHFQNKAFTKQLNRDGSNERFDKKNRNYARDHFQKRRGSSKEKKNGDWHENYMHHRANERQSSEKKRNDKNWFIERGSSREHMRYR